MTVASPNSAAPDSLAHGVEAGEGSTAFDGVICFGGVDWWYHNRGHFDIQLTRGLSRRVPVLYVNSIGMRNPRAAEGRMFLRRVARKARSFLKGLQVVEPRFGVFSPVTGPPSLLRTAAGRFLLARQVSRAARRMGIEKPLLWIACPTAAEILPDLERVGLVYQRTDRFEHYPDVCVPRIKSYDALLKEQADLTLFCSTLVFEEEATECRNALYVDHGVDFERFRQAGDARNDPREVAHLPRPRVGFVGSIDAHTFDPQLFLEVARDLGDCTFVMVGPSSLPDGWCRLPNVHFTGQRDYELVPDYMAACDVLIMPWNRSEWIRACNPVKLKEYLAVGRPVVSTPFDELSHYDGLIARAESAPEFVAAVRRVLQRTTDGESQRDAVRGQTWSARVARVIDALEERRIVVGPSTNGKSVTARWHGRIAASPAGNGKGSASRRNVNYVVITPARDEEDYVGHTIQCVLSQTVLPREWILVNDGSTDATGKILDRHASECPWIRVVHRENRGYRAPGGGVMNAFHAGLEVLRHDDWDYIVKLDGDLRFEPDYFERCFERFDLNPRLGIGGGVIFNNIDGRLEREQHPHFHVRGATKIYRRACWNDIAGLLRIAGWDTLDEVKANMLGWETESFDDVRMIQERYTGEAQGQWRNWVKNGRASYISGYHPLFLMVKAMRRAFRKPYVVASIGLLVGFFGGMLRRVPQIEDRELVRYLRKQQLRRLVGRPSIWR